jgi:hypothetical protein
VAANLRFLGIVLAYVTCCPGVASAQAFIEHLSPPVLQRGTVNRIEVHGDETEGAVGLWSSLPQDQFRFRVVEGSRPGAAAFDVALAGSAPLGIYGLRLATGSGLSNVHLFLVDELPVTSRKVDTPDDTVIPVALPACVTAVCRPAAIDRYAISVAPGQKVAFEVVGNRLGKDYDPLIQIRSSTGKLVAQCDNSVGLFFDCRFAHTFTEGGTYKVDVRDARFDGDATWHYVLRMGDFPEARVAVPSAVRPGERTTLHFPQIGGWQLPVEIPVGRSAGSLFYDFRLSPATPATWIPLAVTDLVAQIEVEPNDALETATPVKVPATLNGVLARPGDSDWYAFDLAQGQKLHFQGVARTLGSAADLELVLFDADQREVRRVDDDQDLEEGSFAFIAGKAGLHRLQVRDVARDGGPDFAYRIDVRSGGPQIQLRAEAADLTIPQGTWQPLPLKVTRTEFAGEIRLELRGAPAGMTLEPAVVPADATEFVTRISAAPTTPEGFSTVQVVGSAALEGGAVLTAVARTVPMVDRYLKNVDLIPYALREDQRHLPPSLTDQIAVMVTPPSPIDVDLPEGLVRLTRYQTADFPIVTRRAAGFEGPITVSVKGGQIGDEAEERNQVYARFTPATADRPAVTGTFFNRINTQLNKYRVDLTASADLTGRRVNLIRTFTLDVQSAFQPTIEPALPTVEPGGTVRVKFLANRVPTFDGPVTLKLSPHNGLQYPETVEIPRGEPAAEIDVKLDAKLGPGRYNPRVEVLGFVGKYEESFNLQNFFIEVKKPAGK